MYSNSPENQPIEQAAVFNQNGSAIDAGTSILATDLVPKKPPSMFRVTVSMVKAGKFKVQLSQGATTIDMVFNNDVALAAYGIYTFEFLVSENDTAINFEQDQADQTINLLVVQEILVGAQ